MYNDETQDCKQVNKKIFNYSRKHTKLTSSIDSIIPDKSKKLSETKNSKIGNSAMMTYTLIFKHVQQVNTTFHRFT